MSSSSSPSPSHEPPRVLFPQECTHDTHCMSHKGDLYTALITGGNRLVLLRNGVVLAQSCPLFNEGVTTAADETAVSTAPTTTTADATTTSWAATACTPSESARALPVSTSRVCAVSVYYFIDDVLRVAVATTVDVLLFEFDDAGQLWVDTRESSFWRTAEDTNVVDPGGTPPPSAAASLGRTNSSASRFASMQGRAKVLQASNAASSPAAAWASGPITKSGQPAQRQGGLTGRLRWRRVGIRLDATLSSTRRGLTDDGSTPFSSTTSFRGVTHTATGTMLRGASAAAAVPVRISPLVHPSRVRAVEFVSMDTLLIVLDSEAVLIVLGNSNAAPGSTLAVGGAPFSVPVPDRVVWRSMGAYRSLAVCRVNHHVALTLGNSTIVVFPSCVSSADDLMPTSAPASPLLVDEHHFSRVASISAPSLLSTKPASGSAHATMTESHNCAAAATPAFSTASRPTVVGSSPRTRDQPTTILGAPAAGARMTLAERALTTSVGIYHITDMQWHCVSSHTLLCVTCKHPKEETAYLMLYTVQSLPSMRRYTNIMREHADGGWGQRGGGLEGEELDTADEGLNMSGRRDKNIRQLVPAGTIALAYTASRQQDSLHTFSCTNAGTACLAGNSISPVSTADTPLHSSSLQQETSDAAALSLSTVTGTTWGGAPPPPVAEMHTGLVPNFSNSAEANSMSSRMEFVHVEGDGTVRTSSYAFGRQKHASFAKQRAVGSACRELLQPLLHRYGALVKVTVLPAWRTRPIELGHDTSKQPCAVEMMLTAARRYRMVLRFGSGVVLAVMVDLSAAVYRVECFLALGYAPLLSLQIVVPLAEAEKVQRTQSPPSSWNSAGSSTILIAGLLGFPTPARPTSSKSPLSVANAFDSLLQDGEDVAEDTEAAQRGRSSFSADLAAASCCASATSYNAAHVSCDSVTASMPPRTVWAVVLLQVELSGMQARVLTTAPLTEVHMRGVSVAGAHEEESGGSSAQDECQRMSEPTAARAGSTSVKDVPPMPLTAASTAAAAGCVVQVTEDDVASFMTLKCPEKLRFMPALLRASQQDAGRLLTQLIAKYGAVEEGRGDVGAAHSLDEKARMDGRKAEEGPAMCPSHSAVRRLSVLTGGCIGAGGEVLLLVRENAFCRGNNGGGEGSGAAALIRLCPPCLETLAPVHRLVATGACYIPFEPMVAEYVPVLAEVQQRWRSQPLGLAQLSSAWGATSPKRLESSVQDVREALRACQRAAAASEVAAVVQCEVVPGSPGTAYVRVRCPLLPDTGEAGARTSLQHLVLPSIIDPKRITCVMGAVLVNHDVVIGVLSRTSERSSAASSVLYLYGRPAVQSLAATQATAAAEAAAAAKPSISTNVAAMSLASGSSAFDLEATLPGVDAFYFSASGEVVLLRQLPAQVGMPPLSGESAAGYGSRFERWLRCFPKEGDSRYSYVQDCTWCPTCSTTGGPLRSDGRGSSVAPETVTALMTLDVAGAWEAETVGLSVADAAKLGSSCMPTIYVLYATTSNSFIHVRQLPLRRSGASTSTSVSSLASVVGEVALPQYHPDAVMQLIGMARWSALAKVLMCIADAVRTVVAPAGAGVGASTVDAASNVTLFDQSPEELARRLCTSAVARGFHDGLQLAQYEEVLHRVTPPQLSVATLHEEETQANATAPVLASSVPCTTAVTHLYDFSATYGALVNELTQLLPQATLNGLDSPEHLKLLCILQALRDTLPLSRSVDEAAARYLFYSRYMALERRLRRTNAATPVATATGSCVSVKSVLSFEVDRTATRTVETASYLWAAMSDSQSTLLSLLFDKTSTVYVDGCAGGGAGGLGDSGCGSGGTRGASAQDLTWEQVKQSGVTFWLRSVADLRAIADRVARHQYQSTKELTDCALMYCAARKVGTLAALAKAQNNQRLHAFFSRDFAGDEHNRAAASANAYAAISKNMPQYGAAFFLLAGDVGSAVQVLLQRCHNPSLALFVLRAAGDSAEEQSSAAETALQWYVAQRTAEAEVCGALDMWELTCLNWLDASPPRVSPEVAVQRRIRALQHIAAHPTAHPETLCVLRYARDRVASLAYRGDQFLSPDREIVYLLRLGRYCLAHRLGLNSYLYYHDAEALLRRLRAEAAAGACSGALQPTSNGGGTSRRAPPQTAMMSADFNTGTLLFRGFDGSDDDEGGNGDSGISTHPRQSDFSSDVGVSAAHASSPVFTLSDEAAAAVEAEVKYVYARIGAIRKPGSATATVTGATADAGECEDLLRCMLLSFTMASSFMMTPSMWLADGGGRAAETGRMPSLAVSSVRPELSSVLANSPEPFQQLLTSLLYLLLARGVSAQQENGATTGKHSGSNGASSGIASAVQGRSAVAALPQSQPAGTALCPEVLAAVPSLSIAAPAAIDGGWHALCVPLLHFLLSKVALRCANYVVLLALQQVPVSTEGVLRTAVQANLMSDDGDVLQGVSATLLSDAGTAVPPLAAPPPPLHRPLTAFFLLLMHHMRSHYSDSCAADGGRLVGGQVSTSPGHQVEAGCDKGRVWGVSIDDEAEVLAEADDGIFVSSEHDEQTHRRAFDALLAAAAAAEASNNFAAQAGRESSRAGACWGSFRPQAYADGTTSGADVPDDSMMLRLTDSAQVSLLLSCCQAQLHLRLMEHLKQLTRSELDSEVMTPTMQRAVDAGLLYADALSPEAQATVVQRRLLQCTLLLDVTLQWSTLSEECMMRIYAAEPQRAPGPLTDPNGVFLEAQHTAGLMRAVLVAVLDAPPRCVQSSTCQATAEASTGAGRGGEKTTYGVPFDPLTPPPMSSTSWLEDSTLTMLELCATQLELFWTLPAPTLTQCCQLAAPTRSALKLLQETTALHRPARVLLERTLRPVKVETGPLVEHTHLRNVGAPFKDAAAASPGVSVFASATLVSTLHKTGEKSPAVRDVALTPEEPHPCSSHTEVYCPALSYMQLSWMRRHHTHALLRRLLLMMMLDRGEGEGQRLVSTDRLIIAQHNHSVTGVHFDASSCDSVVWTTERGTSVGHGFRELLAGDNEEALWKQTTERNLATAAFTLGLTAQHDRLRLASEHAGQKYTPAVIEAVTAKSALESRPRLGEVVNAMPSSHPHLPFFVSRHVDGHLDLYPFASQECVASFRCAVRHSHSAIGRSSGPSSGVDSGHGTASIWRAWGVEAGPTAAVRAHSVRLGGSAGGATVCPSSHHGGCYPVTPVAFSPSGYIIAVGLSDGSVAGWRFAAAAVESAPAFFFEKLFTPFGVRSCTFCGDRSSLMVVVGVAKEPHQCRRGNPTADVTSVLGVRDPRPLSALTPPLVASSSIAATPPSASAVCSSGTAVDVGAGEAVGEMLILDTILGAGAVTARCALPFLPAYAVYITPLRAVLMVSVDGLLATYAVETARFAVLGTVPITTVLRSALGPSLGADGGDADAGVAPSRTGTLGSDTVYITCVAQSNYDPLVAFGVSNGLVLLLHFRNISAGMARTERRIRDEGEDTFVYYPPRALSADSDATGTRWSQCRAAQQMGRGAAASASATARATGEASVPTMDKAFLEGLPQTSVLSEATYMQVAPHVNTRNAIMDLVFSPSMLLAGLQDGKVMAVSLIAHATRACLTAGSGVRVDLLECP